MLWPAALVAVALLWLCRAALLSWRLSQLLSASTTVQAATLGVRWAEGALEVGVAELRTKPPGAPFAPDVGAVAEAKTVVHLASIFKKVVGVQRDASTSLDDDAGIEAVKDKILDALVDVLYCAVDAGAWARLQGSAGGAALASLATRALDSGGLLEVAARKVVPLLEEARRAVESELTSVERSTSPKSRPMVQQLLRDLSDVVDDLLAVRHKTFQAGPTLKLLQRAADVARRLEGVLSKANAEHIALDARHLDDQLLAALSDFALDLGASALTALPPGRVAGDANGVEYAVDHVDLSRVRVTRREPARVAFDRDLGSESLLHVDVYGVDCPLSDLRWSVGKKDSAVFRDEGYAHAAVSNICLGLDLVAARRPGDGRPGGGAPFLALRDARVTVDACALSFDGTAR
ncbi:hypothetical protein JL721_13062 [Aureococcus anophagefferens]|nr:hypothetical protein JL721_13062 [Aureococcus anophagefferens]